MGVSLYLPMKILDLSLDTSRVLPLIFLTLVAGLAGSAVYLFFTWIFKVYEIELFYKLIRKLRFRPARETGAVAQVEGQPTHQTP